jgi:hypothetical protein
VASHFCIIDITIAAKEPQIDTIRHRRLSLLISIYDVFQSLRFHSHSLPPMIDGAIDGDLLICTRLACIVPVASADRRTDER